MSQPLFNTKKAEELFFTFKNIGVALLAGNAVTYSGNPEQWILDTELLAELIDTEAVRFAKEKAYATEQEGTEDTTSNGEVLREGEG